jgi:hypothetical protein
MFEIYPFFRAPVSVLPSFVTGESRASHRYEAGNEPNPKYEA